MNKTDQQLDTIRKRLLVAGYIARPAVGGIIVESLDFADIGKIAQGCKLEKEGNSILVVVE